MSCATALQEWNICLDQFYYTKMKPESRYYLSHFHEDHVAGLNESWDHAAIYVTRVTAELMKLRYGSNSPVCSVLQVCRPYKWYKHGKEGTEVACVPAGHCAGSCMWLFVLPNGSTAVYTGDYRPYPGLYRWKGWSRVVPTSLLLFDSSFHNPRVIMPSLQQGIDGLEQLHQLIRRPQRMVVLAHTGGTEQLIGHWCLTKDHSWHVHHTCKNEKEVYLGLQEIAPECEAKGMLNADVLLVGETFRDGAPNPRYVFVKPSAIWFLCHQNELQGKEQKYRFGSVIPDKTGTFRVNFSCHASYKENMELIEFTRPMMQNPCVAEIAPKECTAKGSIQPDWKYYKQVQDGSVTKLKPFKSMRKTKKH